MTNHKFCLQAATVTALICLSAIPSLSAQTGLDQLPQPNYFGHGTFLVGGSLGYSNTTTDVQLGSGPNAPVAQGGNSTYTVSPQAGYFISNKVAVGVLLGFSGRETRLVASGSNAGGNFSYVQVNGTNTVTFGPYVRYTHMLADRLGLFAQASVAYQVGSTQTSFTSVTGSPTLFTPPRTATNGFTTALLPGFVFFLGKRWGLEASLGALQYINTTTVQDGQPNLGNQTLTANFGLNSLQLGVQLYLGRGAQ